VLGIWIEQTEGAEFCLKVFNELRSRGVNAILIAVVDGLKGLADAITTTLPQTTVQTCIVHLIRSSLDYASWKTQGDCRSTAPDLRRLDLGGRAGYACGRFCLTLWSMGTSSLIAARVSPETKAKFRSLAEQQQMTESALLKQLIELTVQRVSHAADDVLRSPGRRLRAARLYVRLHPDDQWLLRERAAARQMPAATYVSVLVRAHLRDLAPLPKAELMALKRSVAELGAIGRNLNQLTRMAHHQPGSAGPGREDLRMMLKVCEAMRDHTRHLIKANSHAWRVGHGHVPS